MTDVDKLLRANPKAEKQEATVRAAIAALQTLSDSGIRSDGYDLVSPYGMLKTNDSPKSYPKMGYVR